MSKKQVIADHIDHLFKILEQNGFVGTRGKDSGSTWMKSREIKGSWITGKFQKDMLRRVYDEKSTLRFEKKIGDKWVNMCPNKAQYKKDLPELPEGFLV